MYCDDFRICNIPCLCRRYKNMPVSIGWKSALIFFVCFLREFCGRFFLVRRISRETRHRERGERDCTGKSMTYHPSYLWQIIQYLNYYCFSENEDDAHFTKFFDESLQCHVDECSIQTINPMWTKIVNNKQQERTKLQHVTLCHTMLLNGKCFCTTEVYKLLLLK